MLNLFADDTLVYYVSDNYQEAIQVINEELQLLNKWLQANKLQLNTSKTECMLITTSNVRKINIIMAHPDLHLYLDGIKLRLTEKTKYLGVIVDSFLSFKDHIKGTANKISKKTGYLIRLSKVTSKWCKHIIFNTIIAPHYKYCSSIFLDAYKTDINILQRLQNKAMRGILQCDWFTHKIDMLVSLNWMNVQQKKLYTAH
jgi:hypothetical protein